MSDLNKRIPELDPLSTVKPQYQMVVYSTDTDITYRINVGNLFQTGGENSVFEGFIVYEYRSDVTAQNPQTFEHDKVLIERGGAIYKLLHPARPYGSTNFADELAAGDWLLLSGAGAGGADYLVDLLDVNAATATTGQVLYKSAGAWIARTLNANDVGALTKGAADTYYAPLAHNHDTLYAPLNHTHNYLTEAQANVLYAYKSHTHEWASITNTPTTLIGYGITNTYTKEEINILLQNGGGGAVGDSVAWQRFTPNGTATFTLSGDVSGVALVEIGGRVQLPGADFTFSGQDIVLAEILPAGEVLSVMYLQQYGTDSTAHTHSWNEITSKPTSIAGYQITDAYTKTETHQLFAPINHSHDWDSITNKPDLSGSSHTHTFASLTGKPTTIEGYGITNALTKALTDTYYAALNHTHDWTSITGKPATFTAAAHTHPWSQITSTPTTIEGYGITNALTKALADTYYATINHSHTWDQISGKPTTFTPAPHAHSWSEIAGTPTTIEGYGITNAFTQAQADARYATLNHTHLTQLSVTQDASGYKLVGDQLAPGPMMYYGTDNGGAKGYFAVQYDPSGNNVPGLGVAPQWQYFSTMTDTFTLTGNITAVLAVMVDGRIQREGVDYTRAGKTITLTEALVSGQLLGVQVAMGYGVTLDWEFFSAVAASYTLTGTVEAVAVVMVDGRIKREGVDYSIAGQTITLTVPMVSGQVLGVQYLKGVGGGEFISIAANEFGVHPGFSSQHDVNVWLLQQIS